jgi:tRNA pseudouridine38-40 synthase
MPRYKLTIEYAGTRYSGWQIQTNARTIQGELVKAVREATGRDRFEVYGAGRTDAGVHAIAQVAHLDVGTSLAPGALLSRLNESLPADIHVRHIEVASHRFHARHDATARGYLYQIARRRTAFAKPFVWWVRDPLDVGRMRSGAGAFAGMQDFASFTDDDPEEKSTTVAIDAVTVEEAGALVQIRVVGSHFLWKMVRRMVGVLVGVGTGAIDRREITRALTSTSALPATLTAPASGLFLEFVSYGESRPAKASPFAID